MSKQPDGNVLSGISQLPASGLDGWGNVYPAVYRDCIYFIYGDWKKDVVKFDVTSMQHRPIKNSKLPQYLSNRDLSTMLSSHLMLHGNSQRMNGDYKWGEYDFDIPSLLWSFEKEQWIEGPMIPDISYNDAICSVAINRSTILFIQRNFQPQQALSFDLITGSWNVEQTFGTDIDLNIDSCLFHTTKQYQRIVLLVATKVSLHGLSFSKQLFSYDVDLKTWNDFNANNCPLDRLMSVSGSIFNLMLYSEEGKNDTSIAINHLDLDLTNHTCSLDDTSYNKTIFHNHVHYACTNEMNDMQCREHLKFATFQFYYRFFQAI